MLSAPLAARCLQRPSGRFEFRIKPPAVKQRTWLSRKSTLASRSHGDLRWNLAFVHGCESSTTTVVYAHDWDEINLNGTKGFARPAMQGLSVFTVCNIPGRK